MPAILSIHRHTPSLAANDPRGLPVRAVEYWRDSAAVLPQPRIIRTVFNPAGRAIAQWDPRLYLDASSPANLQTVFALSAAQLSTDSVDAGWRVALLGEAGQLIHHWDGRASQRWMQYDEQLRPVSVFEQTVDGDALCTERLGYGASDEAAAARNQCGQLIRHDDPAGTQVFAEFGLHGGVLEQTRHFLNELTLPDWPETIADRELMLEAGEGATTRSRGNAAGDVVKQTDAKEHSQFFRQTLDNRLREVHLQLNGDATPKTLVSAIVYNAQGQTEQEVAGNGVITTLEYDAQDGRLTRLMAQRGSEALQDLRYEYDPVGNILSIEDAALPIRYFANQRIEPANRYRYDSLSQLIEATGWEAGGASKGPQLSTLDDPAPRANYRQTYRYDTGGNLLELIHEGPQNHGHRLVAALHSNRCLPVREGVEPGEEDFRQGFDSNGNLLNLKPGQALTWDLRNQLSEVQPVVRDSGLNDRERYVYGADGMRLRKVRETQTNARTLIAETCYLPNLELRSNSGTGEVLQVISVQAGRSSVRVLHWESAPPRDSANDQYRYHLNDHLGSCTLELDKDGAVISQEHYHPYGTTAGFAGRGEVEASYKTVCYSGKERDATGLYYYGFRYYVAGWQRWLNPDPAGIQDGLNVFAFVTGNPLAFKDVQGLGRINISNPTSKQRKKVGLNEQRSSAAKMMYKNEVSWRDDLSLQRPSEMVYPVGEHELDNLLLADKANYFTKAMYPKGSANQMVDLWRTGENLISLLDRARKRGGTASVIAGVGNCGEHADMSFNLLASAHGTDPVGRVNALGEDHVFVVIGDERVVGLDKVVISDPWVTFPQAHLGVHGAYRLGHVVEWAAAGSNDPKYQVDEEWLDLSLSPVYPIKRLKEDEQKLYKRYSNQVGLYTKWSSLKEDLVGMDYNGGSGVRFSTFEKIYVKDRLDHFKRYSKVEQRVNKSSFN